MGNVVPSKAVPVVLHLITRMDFGGSATNTAATCQRLAERQSHSVVLAAGPSPTADRSLLEDLSRAGVRQVTIPHLVRDPSPVADFRAFTEIVTCLRRHRPGILHTHCSKAGILGRVAGRLLRVPVVVHTPHGHVLYGYFGPAKLRFFLALERLAARCCDRVVSLTDQETRDYAAWRIGVAEQYVTIPSGVPLRRFAEVAPQTRTEYRRQLGIREDETVFLCVARLEPVKGVDLLIRAWSHLSSPAPLLLVAGAGAEQLALERLARELGLADRIRFLGERLDVPCLLHTADGFALASRNEGMGRAFIEAMAAGLPVVGTDVGGVATFLRHEYNGLLVPPEDPEALAAAIARLAGSPEQRSRLGAAGQQTVFPDYDEDTMVKRILDLYAEVGCRKGVFP